MSATIVLDACALLALLEDEPGADKILEVYDRAVSGEVALVMNTLNLLEVYYALYRGHGKEQAGLFFEEIKRSPVFIKNEISEGVFVEAGRLKASYKISLADSIALAEASVSGGALLTADHHEFDIIEQKERIAFHWFR